MLSVFLFPGGQSSVMGFGEPHIYSSILTLQIEHIVSNNG